MSKFFIEHPIFANVIAIVIVILGVFAYLSLPVAQYPEIVPPTIQVTTSYPGASSEVVANTVGIPIEQAVNGVENSIYLSSTSASDGSYTLTVTFNVGTDLNTSLALVQNAVNGATAQLPPEVQAQGVTVKKVSTNILMFVSLFSDDNRFDGTFLSNYATINLVNPLARLPGTGQVKVVGAGAYSMRIWLDANKMQSFGLTTLDVLNAVQTQNVQVAAGQLGGPPVPDDQSYQITLTTLGRLTDVSEFENIIVKSVVAGPSARIVRVKDVARVELSQQNYANFGGLNGKIAAHIAIYALPGANALDLADEVRAAMTAMSKRFPEGMQYAALYDTTRFISQSIEAVLHTLFEAFLLVMIVVIAFLQNWRAVIAPAVIIPIVIIGSFIAMAALGFTVNLMTLFALILAIGIVVDDAIIVVENASHYIEQGMAPRPATIKAMGELMGPIAGITLVLTAVFVPASFQAGITGNLFRQFALVIAATAVFSALIALTVSPSQCAIFLKPHSGKRPNVLARAFNAGYQAVEDGYMRVVRFMASHTRMMCLVFALVVGTAGFLFTRVPTGFLPTEDQGYCIISVALPPGASQPRAKEVAEKINAILAGTPGLAGWAMIGGLSILDNANLPTAISMFPVYEEFDKRPEGTTQDTIVADLRRRLSVIQEAAIAVLVPPAIPGLGQAGGFQMMVEDRQSLGLGELQKAVRELVAAANAQSNLQGVVTTFRADSPQYFLDIDRTQASSLGVPLNDVFNTLQTFLGSSFVNLFNKFNQSFQVRVQADSQFRRTIDDIGNLYVANREGKVVPLGALLTVTPTLGTELVNRYNLYPAANVFGAAAPGASSGQALSLMEQVAGNTLPAGADFDWTSISYQEKLVGSQIYIIFALSITLVFLVLAAQYENWFHPFAVILTVPMALVGILIALKIRGFPVDLYTQIGLVLMVALAAKNAILVVEFARELRAKGMGIVEAAVEATQRRFRPIVMTSFAFILGVVPLVIASGAGAASQQSLGTVVFGGMVASTLLAIPFCTVFYIETERLSEWMKRGRKQPDALAGGAAASAPQTGDSHPPLGG
jgi:HAE1 family hydrophobic/amphiphilic exporter-1